MSIEKLDLRKTLGYLYHPPTGDVEVLKIPRMKCLMVDGGGAPESDDFKQAIGTIYNVAFTMKFRSKKLLGKDYSIMALEGLWGVKGGGFNPKARDDWIWTLMMVQPDLVSQKLFTEAVAEVRAKKNPPGLERIHLENFAEGLCVQSMHVGPYSTEAATIERLESYAKEHGFKMVGKHHEIYLGDPRRAKPEKLRTIVRHPIAKG